MRAGRKKSAGTPGRLDANRIWRVPTADGALVQKLYCERGPFLRRLGTHLGNVFFPLKTRPGARGRHRTERRLLRAWREAGLAVPIDLTDRHPELGGPRVAILEFVEGRPLGSILRDDDLPRDERDELLGRFARDWGHRLGLALDGGRSDLVQNHATIQHVLVTPDRLVSIDLERHQRSRNLLPLIAREVGNVLKSLAKRAKPEDVLRADLTVIVRSFPRRQLLEDVVREAFRSRSPFRRVGWAFDRLRTRLRRKPHTRYTALAALESVLVETAAEERP
jgi:hypothetical protein